MPPLPPNPTGKSAAPVEFSFDPAAPVILALLVMTASAALPHVPAKLAEERPQTHPATPPEDDPPAENAAKPLSGPPTGPSG